MAHPVLALWAIVGYVVWTLLILVAILTARLRMMLVDGKRLNEFPGGVQHGGDRYWRLYRAHMNIVENLPIIIPVLALFYAFATPSGAWVWLPLIALAGRVVQSLAHVASGSVPAVMVRFSGFATQIACVVLMLIAIARRLPAAY